MQTPSALDTNFKAFLDKLQEQNNRGFLTQLAQLKTEREIAGEDGDKREEQLDEAVLALRDLKVAVTGISIDVNIEPLVNIGENQTRLLEEMSRESALIRKLTEGSVEYDKAAAQYRNTSGREVESLVTGKVSKKGGFLDFETARSATSGQSERARKANEVTLKPISYTPGKVTSKVTGAAVSKKEESVVSELPDMRGFFATLIDEMTAAPSRVRDYLIDHVEKSQASKDRESYTNNNVVEKNKDNTITNNVEKITDTKASTVTNNVVEKNKDNTITNNVEKITDTKASTVTNNVEKVIKDNIQELSKVERVFRNNSSQDKSIVEKVIKEREAKVSSNREKPVSLVNPESDNITDSQEIIADNSKSDLELSKQMLDTTREQLVVLKTIKEALAPSTPKELTEQKSAPSSTNEKESEGRGSLIGDLAGAAGNLLGGGRGRPAGKATGIGGKIIGGLGKAARVLGPAAAIAGAAYSGVSGYQNTGANFDLKEGEEATIGQKTASTLGGVASGLTFGLLDEKTAAQGIYKAGEAISDTASKAGSYIGEKASSIGSSISNFFGVGSKDTSKSVSTQSINNTTSTVNNNTKASTVSSAPSIVQGVSTEAAAAARSNYATVDPRRVDISSAAGATVAQTSTENADMSREPVSGGNNNTVVSNNVNNNQTTTFMPSKPMPRPEFTGSSLDRYLNRIAVY